MLLAATNGAPLGYRPAFDGVRGVPVSLTIAVAVVSYLLMERPFLCLKRRSPAPTPIQAGSRGSDELRAAS